MKIKAVKPQHHLTPFIIIIIHILLANFIVILSKQAFVNSEINPLFFLFLRNTLSFIILLPIIYPIFIKTFKTHKYHISFARSSSGIIAITLWTYAYSHIPLANATVLTFIIPIITLILASIFLKEKVSFGRITVILIGIIGAFIALHPSFGSANFYYILVIIATVFWGISNIARKFSTRGNIKVFLCYYSLWSIILTGIISIPFWKVFPVQAIPFILITGIITSIVNIMSFNSYKYNDVSLVQSFDFLRLVIVSIADIFIFGVPVSADLFLGSVIIVSASVWLILHESKKLKSVANVQI